MSSAATGPHQATGPHDEGQAHVVERDVDRCVHCRAPMASDQEWCLECGASRTIVHGPPNWRIPLTVVGVVVLLILVAFAIALINLSSQANRSAQTTTRIATAATTTSAGATHVAIGSWPLGLPGWTVVLASTDSQARAQTIANQLGARGTPVGILDSSQHPSMRPGQWIVFSGRFPTESAARIRAQILHGRGDSDAQASLVGLPGG